MSTTLRQLAELVQGELCGDGDLVIHAARPLGEAEPGSITFVEDEKHALLLNNCRASAVVARNGLSTGGLSGLRVADPVAAFVAIMRHLHGRGEPPTHGIDARAFVHPSARIGEGCSIYPFACIGEESTVGARCRIYSGVVVGRFCRLGNDVILYPNSVLYDQTILGDRTIIHANAVLGADGFGYRFYEGRHVKVPQLGNVEIGADVEVGACTTIDRGTFQATRIGDGTKMDNLVMVAHNCQIGRHNLFVSQVGIAGSSSTGDYVVVAGQAGIVDHVRIGDRAIIGAQAGVTKEVAAGQTVLGSPATPVREQRRILMTMEKLPEIRRDVQRIKRELGIEKERIEDRGYIMGGEKPKGDCPSSILHPPSSILYPPSTPIGLLAGGGRFPIVFAEKARSLGIPVVGVGLRHEADPQLAQLVQRFHWVGLFRLGRIIRCFKRAGVHRLVMAGKVRKAVYMHKPWRIFSLWPDWRTLRFLYWRSRRDNRDDTLLLDVIGEFAAEGLRCESALDLCPELLVGPGILTRRRPSAREERDIAFGWELAKEMGRLDVGQSVAVKERAVLAVEAIEGTDQAIARAGELCRAGGFVVVKVAKPQQDMRFDVPTVGCATIETMSRAGGRVLAIEAGKTIVLDEADTIALADRCGITIVALPPDDMTPSRARSAAD